MADKELKYKHTITLKLDTKTFTKLNNLTSDLQTTKSELIRQILNEIDFNKTKQMFEYKKQKERLESDLIYHLNKIGNNINQIARACNINSEVDLAVLKELQKINEKLDIIIDES